MRVKDEVDMPSCVWCQNDVSDGFSWQGLLSLSIFRKEKIGAIENWLCYDCLDEVKWLSEGCARCSRSLIQLDPQFIGEHNEQTICYDCFRWTQWEERMGMGRILTSNRSGIEYNDWAQQVFQHYKFRGDERLKYFLASVIVMNHTGESNIECVAPIPLVEERLSQRGFNQSALIARLVAESLHLPYEEHLLMRVKDTQKQSKKKRTERLQEMLHKFINNPSVTVDIKGKNILIIDDIYTTGATLYAAAYTLKKNGARHVYAYTIAR